ncbi:extracellular solute-binding protein [Streptomyces sp. 549]|uniref:extracellular solute-binding protein n=1 Tax=Streptomyces sp. 549 TaxID=3049076 RepID=UPI0024C3DC47|nr:extracellular solute-binding protein [Streptomyces sp. 549]MDK1474063.1 extracellular solute-binding protein [Streptomyces sp. 549]
MRRDRSGMWGMSGISHVAASTVLAVTASLGVAACGTESGGADLTEISGKVTWWDTSGGAEAPFFNQLVAAFEKKYPKIDVTYVNVDFFEAQAAYLKAVQTGTGVPDVLRADVGWMAGFVEDGHLADLTGTPALGGEDDFLETTTAGVTFDDRTYGVPQVTDPLALLYNKRLLEEAGVSRVPATWKELKEAALTVKRETGADGLALNTDAYFSLPFLHGEQTDLIDPDVSTISIAGPDALRGVSTAADLVSSGAARKPPEKDAYGAMQTAFKRGEVAMVINGPWATADVFEGKEFEDQRNLGIAPVPAGSSGKAGSPTGGHNLVVSQSSADIEAAQVFVGFMTAPEQQESAAVELGLLPTRKTAYSKRVLSDPVRNSFYFAHTKSVPRRSIPESAALFAAYEPHWTAILRGEQTPQEGLTETAEKWKDDLLPGYRVER